MSVCAYLPTNYYYYYYSRDRVIRVLSRTDADGAIFRSNYRSRHRLHRYTTGVHIITMLLIIIILRYYYAYDVTRCILVTFLLQYNILCDCWRSIKCIIRTYDLPRSPSKICAVVFDSN